jgi:hypothetical protein
MPIYTIYSGYNYSSNEALRALEAHLAILLHRKDPIMNAGVELDRTALMRRIEAVAQRKAKYQDIIERDTRELRSLIHDGFELEIPGSVLAKASGYSLPRVYQMRDEVRHRSMFDVMP